jgi:hypothetical protein
MLDLHREKTQMSTPEQSRRHRKMCPKSWGPPAIGQGQAPTGTGVAARGQEPIRFYLVDPASTDFKE